MGQTLLLSEQDVHDLLSMEDVVAAVEKTFQGMGEGTVVNPSKVNLDLGESAPYPPYSQSLVLMIFPHNENSKPLLVCEPTC